MRVPANCRSASCPVSARQTLAIDCHVETSLLCTSCWSWGIIMFHTSGERHAHLSASAPILSQDLGVCLQLSMAWITSTNPPIRRKQNTAFKLHCSVVSDNKFVSQIREIKLLGCLLLHSSSGGFLNTSRFGLGRKLYLGDIAQEEGPCVRLQSILI